MFNFMKKLSPKRRIAALVDAVFDRMNDKYKFVLKVVDGGFEVEIQDKKPKDHEDLPEDD